MKKIIFGLILALIVVTSISLVNASSEDIDFADDSGIIDDGSYELIQTVDEVETADSNINDDSASVQVVDDIADEKLENQTQKIEKDSTNNTVVKKIKKYPVSVIPDNETHESHSYDSYFGIQNIKVKHDNGRNIRVCFEVVVISTDYITDLDTGRHHESYSGVDNALVTLSSPELNEIKAYTKGGLFSYELVYHGDTFLDIKVEGFGEKTLWIDSILLESPDLMTFSKWKSLYGYPDIKENDYATQSCERMEYREYCSMNEIDEIWV